MVEKIKSVKEAILDRIYKNVVDESKSISAEMLRSMSEILIGFEQQEILATRKDPYESYVELLSKIAEKEYEEEVPKAEVVHKEIPAEIDSL